MCLARPPLFEPARILVGAAQPCAAPAAVRCSACQAAPQVLTEGRAVRRRFARWRARAEAASTRSGWWTARGGRRRRQRCRCARRRAVCARQGAARRAGSNRAGPVVHARALFPPPTCRQHASRLAASVWRRPARPRVAATGGTRTRPPCPPPTASAREARRLPWRAPRLLHPPRHLQWQAAARLAVLATSPRARSPASPSPSTRAQHGAWGARLLRAGRLRTAGATEG
jgi:hypothetical protein